MTSCNATAPIDIPTSSNVNTIEGTFNCVYDPAMCSGAYVTISDDLSHLSVKCSNGTSTTISFYGRIYVPTEIRIYAPSLHTYNGSPTDAEMLIVHTPSVNDSSVNNAGLIVSIPITMTAASSSANSDLAAIIQAANSISASTIALNASAPLNYDVNVNSFIPAKPYYVYYGTLPYDSCGGNYYYAAFTDPISAVGPLSNIVASNIATVPPSMKTNLQKSKTGPVTGVGTESAEKYVLFQVVGDGDGDDDDNDAASNSSSADGGTQSIGMNIVWGIIIAIILMGIAYMFLSNGNGNGNGNGNAVNVDAAPTSS